MPLSFRIILFSLILLITIAVYYSGLPSGFWGDDFINLYGLDFIHRDGMMNYIFSGIAGPSGRPLSLFSFALQYPEWPVNSLPFKVVNLIIHLMNGVLIYLICHNLTQYLKFMC